MGMFDKKFCDICGEKIGLLGNRKLDDGNMCKDCASKLSPFFSERRSSTIEEIKQQLAYREQNAQQLGMLHPTRVIGRNMKIYLDDNARKFVVTRSTDWRKANPDLIDFAQVQSCQINIDEDRDEQYQETADGKRVSYNPPRYEYEYKFMVQLNVNSPWFSEIEFELSEGNRPDSPYTELYREYQRQAEEIRATFGGMVTGGPSNNAGFMNNGVGATGFVAGVAAAVGAAMNGGFNQGYAQQPGFNQGYAQQPGFNQGYAQQPGFNQGYAQQPGGFAQQQAVAPWTCACGTVNTTRFCTACGTPKPVQIRCDKCGWTPAPGAPVPKFCPQCGDPIDANDAQ